MPHEGDLTIEICAAGRYIIWRGGMVPWEVPARAELNRSKAGPAGQPRHPRLCTRRVKYLGAPGEVRRIFIGVVEIVMMIVKMLLAALVHTPGRAAVETAIHPLGKVRLEGVSYRD